MLATGIHHIALAVSDWSRSEPFYKKLAEVLGAQPFLEATGAPHRSDNGRVLIFAGNGFMFSIWEALSEQESNNSDYNVGLHHFAFQAPSREAVDQLYESLNAMDADMVDAPAEYDYVPGYYAVFFRDPDGFRIEYAHIPV